MNREHTVLLLVDHEGRVVQSDPEDNYTGCWVPEANELKSGALLTYQTPDRKRSVLLQIPIYSIKTV
ncbi:MAG: hypothetical protein JNL05_10430 [Flavobacteriales bacterium]|nr:hypothetical protein [Flavobacteriales bacterium]